MLYRLVGLRELELIASTSYRAFPPRFPNQPIFYPVLNVPYARQTARDWNTKSGSFVGFVTGFEVDDAFVSRYRVQTVCAHVHEELWVPAEELDEFNRHIAGTIEVIESYAGPEYAGQIDPATNCPAGWEPRPAGE